MASSDPLASFVHEALLAGRSRAEIAVVLGDAGWSKSDVDKALAAYADVDFVPPVPRPRPQLTARDAFVYAVTFTALGFTAVYLVNLLNNVVDILMPDPAEGDWYGPRASYSIRWAIAVLLVATPIYIAMTVYTERGEASAPRHDRSLVRKWLTYVALFLSAVTFFGDLIYVIYSFLAGELTARFLVKAAIVAAVAGGVFAFYLREAEAGRQQARVFLAGTAIVVLAAIAAGFAVGGVPSQAREARFDALRYSELTDIARVLNCAPERDEAAPLPDSLSDSSLRDHCPGATVTAELLMDDETGQPYTYVRESDSDYRVCATFHDTGNVIGTRAVSLRNVYTFDPASGCVTGTMGTPEP